MLRHSFSVSRLAELSAKVIKFGHTYCLIFAVVYNAILHGGGF
jgi:hypothetical protein